MKLLPRLLGERVLYCVACRSLRWHTVTKLNTVFDIKTKESSVFYEALCLGLAPQVLNRRRPRYRSCYRVSRYWIPLHQWEALVHCEIYVS